MKKLFTLTILATLLLIGTAFAQGSSPPMYADYNLMMATMEMNSMTAHFALTAQQPQTNVGMNLTNVNGTPAIPLLFVPADTATTTQVIQPATAARTENPKFYLSIWTERGSPPPVLRDAMNVYKQNNEFDNAHDAIVTVSQRNELLKVSESAADDSAYDIALTALNTTIHQRTIATRPDTT